MSFIRSKSIYLSVSLIIIVPLILLNIYYAIDHRDGDLRDHLLHVDHMVEQLKIILEDPASQESPRMIDIISEIFPEYHIGIYNHDTGQLISYPQVPITADLLNWLAEAAQDDAGEQRLERHDDNLIHTAHLISNQHGRQYLIVSIDVQDIYKHYYRDILLSSLAVCMVWILTMLLIRALTSRFKQALDILSYQIQIDEEHQANYHIYPDIKPILERINRKNNDLRNMAQKYINESYKMKQLMDMTPLGILSIDERGTITACNATYALYYPELEKDRLLGMNIRTLAERSKMPEVERSIEKALDGIPTNASTLEYDDRVLLIYAYPIYDENQKITGALGICQDITEIERLRNELHRIDRLHVIGQMAASFAHEVRNPLTVIRGFMQLMQRQMEPDKMQAYLGMVISELDRANEIIGNFLSLSQNRFLQKDKMNLNQVIEEIEALLHAEASHSNIELIIEKDPNLQDLMLNDKEIKQLILNLTRNGIESMTSNGTGTLYIRTIQEEDAAVLEVQDTGHGIPKNKLDHLFEPFYTTKPSGTGLGLAVCLSIVERHQAKIDVRSEENVGTTFTIRFNTLEESSKHVG